MNRRAIDYFQKSAVQYSKGDLDELLRKQIKCAGPLLAVILNGIDNLGGMCYGFDRRNVGKRSVKIHGKKDGGPKREIAKGIYESVRCGVVHQGMPKIGIALYLDYDRLDRGAIVRKDSNWIWLNVTELAHQYLDTLTHIASEPERHIIQYPKRDAKAKKAFDKAFAKVRDSISDLMDHISHREESMWEEKLKRGEIEHMPSKSAYNPENVFALRMDLPPQE
jgi:hypothetical protein